MGKHYATIVTKKQIITELNKNTLRVWACTNDWGRPGCNGKYGGVGWYRTINPLEKLGCEVEKGRFNIGAIEQALEMKKRADIWFIKPIGDIEPNQLIRANAMFTGAKLVLDIDDDPFSVDPNHPDFKYHKGHENSMRYQIESVDHVVVSTEPLRQSLSKYHDKITVIPNAIDPAIWKLRKPKKRTDGRIRIGWIGSASHLADREVVQDAILEIMEKYPHVDFYHAGMSMIDDTEMREFSFKGTKGYEEYPKFLNKLDLDIAIAPIKDTQFNHCKSNIKWLEHSMLKTPMVLSDVYPYSTSVINGKTGYLAKGKNQWVKYLSWLIENPKKRKEIGENAYQAVLKDWLIEKQLPKYDALFKKIMPKNITVYTSIIGNYDKLSKKEIPDANMVAFTDQSSPIWETKEPYDKFIDPTRNSRIQKIMPHLFLDTEYSIYLDGNFELKVPAQELIDTFLKDKDIAVFKHGGRDCIYQEAEAILGYQKETMESIREQVKDYSGQGVKAHAGLCACGIIIRRHTPRINQLNEKWWAHYCRYSKRDQMSFPVVFPLEEVNVINSPYYEENPYVKFVGGHK